MRKTCQKEYNKQWRRSNPARCKEYRRRDKAKNPQRHVDANLRRAYGIGRNDAEAMLVEQGGGCAICRKTLAFPDKFTHVDHCHTTGAVRGILCGSCNFMLGYAKDNPGTLLAAVEYLRRTT
jgi:hypothetical protein